MVIGEALQVVVEAGMVRAGVGDCVGKQETTRWLSRQDATGWIYSQIEVAAMVCVEAHSRQTGWRDVNGGSV